MNRYDWANSDYVMYKRALKAEVLEYMRDKDIGMEEAYHYFERIGRRPSLGTMKAVRKEVERRGDTVWNVGEEE